MIQHSLGQGSPTFSAQGPVWVSIVLLRPGGGGLGSGHWANALCIHFFTLHLADAFSNYQISDRNHRISYGKMLSFSLGCFWEHYCHQCWSEMILFQTQLLVLCYVIL